MKEAMQCAIENMSTELKQCLVAPPILSIPLKIKEWIKGDGIVLPDEVCAQITGALGKYGSHSFFVKLSTRSPKDFFSNSLGEIYPIKSIDDIQNALGGCSMRIFDDLMEAKASNTSLQLHILPWVYIPPQDEWRCFVRNAKLIAISQYFYNIGFRDFAPNKKHIIAFASQYLRHLPMQDIVMDIVSIKGLLELNPYGQSDPCLFTYAELDAMNGDNVAFRYNTVNNVSE